VPSRASSGAPLGAILPLSKNVSATDLCPL